MLSMILKFEKDIRDIVSAGSCLCAPGRAKDEKM